MKDTIFSEIKRASKVKSLFLQIFDIIRHKIKINTSPIDYYRYEFYRNDITWEEKSRYLGKRCSNFYPYQNNSVRFVSLFDNKYIFSTMLSGFGIPHPKLLATIGEDYQIKTFEQFRTFLEENKMDMVLKPLDGSGGRGVIVLNFKNNNHCVLEGPCSSSGMWEQIMAGKKSPHPYLIEERIDQDDSVSMLYPYSLNTMRVITVKTKDKEWNLLGARLRVGQKGQVDNLGAGGIQLRFDDSGKSWFAYDWASGKEISRHPITKAELIGFQVPQYHEAIALALKASEKFSFMGTVGWDIGFSKHGPMIIEGNIFYDCLYWQLFGQPPLIPPDIAGKLKRHRWWQRWDKTAMYPNCNRYKIKG
ncbi:hypothetical protein HNR65_003353 [Desulfosalsimonas propionicica]|uniref:ATP-grasp domain-containing protein n=1 Tax=Desulfosalsimonas propionicica TaxID=332175 RepID=A0A7W0HME7_9BACT|nr:sugar-transfer associated ATP-grasp domain-containing protein [Desulfosalsimonas propionicica]MBA2882996.1 hypothetical protein [Desulfosalsimonas propionicica]